MSTELRRDFECWVLNNCREVAFPVWNCREFTLIIDNKRYLVNKQDIPEEFIGVAL